MTFDSSTETRPEQEAEESIQPAQQEGSNAPAETPEAASEQPAAEAPAPEQPVAETAPAAEEAPAPAAEQPAAADDAAPIADVTPDTEQPAVGPKILGVAEEPKPLPSSKLATPQRKRRRRPTAAERHRRAFFAALTEMRRSGRPPVDNEPSAEDGEQGAADEAQPTGEAEATETPAAEAPAAEATAAETTETPAADAPAAETPAAEATETPAAETAEAPVADATATEAEAPADDDQPDESGDDQQAKAPPLPPSPARVSAAIDRAGGVDIVREALKPKQDEKGQPMRWAAVCAQAAEGKKPGDPVFNAWVRLAATPVREVKSQLPRPEGEDDRGRGRRRPGGRPGGRDGRGRREDRTNRAELASHGSDGGFRNSIRIISGEDKDEERRERERQRKEQREAKRAAERERLARLGY